MKYVMYLVLCCLLGSASLAAQTQVTIQPFSPNEKDAQALKSLLTELKEGQYGVMVKNQRAYQYGKLKPSRVQAGASSSLASANGNNAWVKEVLTSVLESFLTANDAKTIARLQQIATRYRAPVSMTMKPFRPSSADAKVMLSSLQKMDQSRYYVQVSAGAKPTTYGRLKAGSVSGKVASLNRLDVGSQNAWVKEVLTKVLESTLVATEQDAILQLQAIAAKYQR